MADHSAFVPNSPSVAASGARPPVAGARAIATGAVTTYYYRTSGGARASTTDAGSIPAGAVVERVT